MIEKNPKWIQIKEIGKKGKLYKGRVKLLFLSLKLGCESSSYYNAECVAI